MTNKDTILIAIRAPNFLPYLGELVNKLKTNFNVVIVFDKRFSSKKKFDTTEKMVGPDDNRKHFRYTLKHLAGVLTYNLDSSSNLKYQRRWRLYLPRIFQVMADIIKFFHLDVFMIRIIRSLYKVLKFHRWTFKILDELKPSLIIVVPGNNRFSIEDDFLLTGKERGIPTAVIVPTWDSITNKGTWISSPDTIFCWNSQHASQLEKHLIDSEIKCLGAPFFDKWYNKKVSNKKNLADFYLRDGEEYILYFGSSSNIIQNEENEINKLCQVLKHRYADRVKLLFKPHPAAANNPQVFSSNFRCLEKNPIYSEADLGFIDLVKNALFVTGVNTSAFLDCIVLGAEVLPIIVSSSLQTDTQHFQMLKIGLVELIYAEDICKYVDRQINKTKKYPGIKHEKMQDFFPNGGDSSEAISLEIQDLLRGP
jgi:hypothetical protein